MGKRLDRALLLEQNFFMPNHNLLQIECLWQWAWR